MHCVQAAPFFEHIASHAVPPSSCRHWQQLVPGVGFVGGAVVGGAVGATWHRSGPGSEGSHGTAQASTFPVPLLHDSVSPVGLPCITSWSIMVALYFASAVLSSRTIFGIDELRSCSSRGSLSMSKSSVTPQE